MIVPIEHSRWVIADRDGTLIVDQNYRSDPDDVQLLPGVVAGLTKIAELGLKVVVVSNQSGIGRGYFGESDVHAVNTRMNELLAEHSLFLAGIYFCPHEPRIHCVCRKPKTQLLERAASDIGFVAKDSFMIGDKPSDIELGVNLGSRTVLISSDSESVVTPDFVVQDLVSASDWIATVMGDD